MFHRFISRDIFFTRRILSDVQSKAWLSYSHKNIIFYQDIFNGEKYKNRTVSKNKVMKNKNVTLDKSNLSSLSHKEFLDVLENTLTWPSVDEEIKVFLKKECFSRQPFFDNVSTFYCASILKKHDFLFDDYIKATAKRLVFQWEQIISGKEDVLLLAHFLVLSKSSTIIPLMDKVEKFLKENMSVMSSREIGLMCHLFFSTNNRIKEFGTMEALGNYILTNLTNTDFYLTDLNNMVKVLRHAHYSNVSFFQQLGDTVCNKLLDTSCSFTHLSNLAFSYASLNIKHTKLLNTVTGIFCNKLENIDQKNCSVDAAHDCFPSLPRLKDYSRLLWSRAFFSMDVSETLEQHILKLLRSDPSQAYKYPEIFIEALTALAIGGTYDQDLLKLAFSQRFIRFKQGRTLEQNYQMLLLRSASSIEDGFSEQINSEQKKYFDAVVPSIEERLSHDITHRQGLFATIHTLHKILGDRSFKVHYILDFSRITGIHHLSTTSELSL